MNRILQIILLSVIMVSFSCNPDRHKMPITTSSDEARELFIQGREMYENYLEEYADNLFQQAVELDPDFALAHLWRWNDTGTKKAKDLIDQVSKGESLMIRAYEAFLNDKDLLCRMLVDSLADLHPRDVHSLFFAGERWSYYDERKAIEYYKQALRLDSYYSAPYIRTCVLLKRLNSYDEAEKLYERYIGFLPESGISHVVYGTYLLEMGDIQEAIKLYKRALECDPYYVAAYKYLIWANILIEDYPESIKYCDELYDSGISDTGTSEHLFHSSKEIALCLMAVNQFVQFDYTGTIDIVDSLIQLNRNSSDHTEMLRAMHLKSWYEMEAGFLDKAFKTLSEASLLTELEDLGKETRISSAFWTNGIKSLLFARQGDLIQAEEFLNKANSLFNAKNNSDLEDMLLSTFESAFAISQGQYDLAISHALLHAKKGPNPCRYYLAKAYDLAGKKEEAFKYYSLNCQIMNPFFSGLFYNESKERLEALEND